MLKKTIKYTDYNDQERDEDFYFNLSKAELTEMEMSHDGGLSGMIDRIVKAQDGKKIIEVFKELVLKSYGVKSDDGRRFIKNAEIRDSFAQTEAFSELFMELATDANAASAFISGIAPQMAKQPDSNHPALKN
jgi:hypothetical protein